MEFDLADLLRTLFEELRSPKPSALEGSDILTLLAMIIVLVLTVGLQAKIKSVCETYFRSLLLTLVGAILYLVDDRPIPLLIAMFLTLTHGVLSFRLIFRWLRSKVDGTYLDPNLSRSRVLNLALVIGLVVYIVAFIGPPVAGFIASRFAEGPKDYRFAVLTLPSRPVSLLRKSSHEDSARKAFEWDMYAKSQDILREAAKSARGGFRVLPNPELSRDHFQDFSTRFSTTPGNWEELVSEIDRLRPAESALPHFVILSLYREFEGAHDHIVFDFRVFQLKEPESVHDGPQMSPLSETWISVRGYDDEIRRVVLVATAAVLEDITRALIELPEDERWGIWSHLNSEFQEHYTMFDRHRTMRLERWIFDDGKELCDSEDATGSPFDCARNWIAFYWDPLVNREFSRAKFPRGTALAQMSLVKRSLTLQKPESEEIAQ